MGGGGKNASKEEGPGGGESTAAFLNASRTELVAFALQEVQLLPQWGRGAVRCIPHNHCSLPREGGWGNPPNPTAPPEAVRSGRSARDKKRNCFRAAPCPPPQRKRA